MIKKIAPGQSDYPRLLSEINDPPQILRYDGDLSISSRSEERRVGKECRSRWSPYH